MIQTKNYTANTHVANVPCSPQKGLAKETFAGLNIIFTLTCVLSFVSLHAQIVSDTFFNGLSSSQHRPISNGIPDLKTWGRYGQYELAQKGIVPGSIIYGLSYYKGTTGYFLSGTSASFDVKFRSGDIDSTIPNIPNYPNYYTAVSFIIDSIFLGSNINSSNFTLGNNLIIPATTGWLPPLMIDVPFTYTGGTLDINTFWHVPANSYNGTVAFIQANGPLNINDYYYHNYVPNSLGGILNIRPALIIFHTGPPPPCTGYPNGGIISGITNVCKNQLFTLYLNNPSAGPDITYQWQQSATNPIIWSNIAGATNPSLKTSTAAPTTYRCKVTCNNSSHSSYSNSFNIVPHYFNIDSVVTSITGNMVTFNEFDNDTSFTIFRQYYTNTWDTLMSQTNPFTKIYTTDGTYSLIYTGVNMCNADTVYGTVTIGCAGSPTFQYSIASSLKTCPGNPVTLSLLDTLPTNYTTEWQAYLNFQWTTLTGLTTPSVTVNPTTNTIYRNKSTCNISTNFKYSNLDTVWVTPPPTAGTIQATNTTTNYYNFTNNGMSNAQTYKWFFGDGDSSTSLAPSHHYGPAGTYTVAFVVTNAGNGCSDTAFTTVNITTGVEETNLKLFTVSPNPFNESFTVYCPTGKGTITITDAVGKEIVRLSLSKPSQTIDLKSFSKGIYLIKYQNNNTTETQKIMKSN